MSRAVASLALCLAAWVLLGLVLARTLALYGSIFGLMLAFVGTFSAFVARDAEAPARQNRVALVAILVGCAALLVGSGLFLRAIVATP